MPNKKVVVAMSGGVDSSVAALLLKREGYDVIGATMELWKPPIDKGQAIGSSTFVEDARRVAAHLGIPHYVLDFQQEFAGDVIQYFCSEYLKGRTPNPCVACNRHIKFGILLKKALYLGAEYLATGHYARVMQDGNDYVLLKGTAAWKDQSYVLYSLTQDQLSHVLLPLGTWDKAAIRELAREAGLPVADKSDSQDICFVPDGHHSQFVEEYLGEVIDPGTFRYRDGRNLGRHFGIHKYTIGQRKGLGLAMGHPVFVTNIDHKDNTIWIGEDQDLMQKSLLAVDANYISGEPFEKPTPITAKIRYSARPAEALATSLENGHLRLDFAEPQRAITPGQSVVMYCEERVLGGAVIDEIIY